MSVINHVNPINGRPDSVGGAYSKNYPSFYFNRQQEKVQNIMNKYTSGNASYIGNVGELYNIPKTEFPAMLQPDEQAHGIAMSKDIRDYYSGKAQIQEVNFIAEARARQDDVVSNLVQHIHNQTRELAENRARKMYLAGLSEDEIRRVLGNELGEETSNRIQIHNPLGLPSISGAVDGLAVDAGVRSGVESASTVNPLIEQAVTQPREEPHALVEGPIPVEIREQPGRRQAVDEIKDLLERPVGEGAEESKEDEEPVLRVAERAEEGAGREPESIVVEEEGTGAGIPLADAPILTPEEEARLFHTRSKGAHGEIHLLELPGISKKDEVEFVIIKDDRRSHGHIRRTGKGTINKSKIYISPSQLSHIKTILGIPANAKDIPYNKLVSPAAIAKK